MTEWSYRLTFFRQQTHRRSLGLEEMDSTLRKRSKIVTLSQHTSMSRRTIAENCGASVGTVNNILKTFHDTGPFSPQRNGKCRGKRRTTPAQDRLLIRKSKINPKLYAVDLARDLGKSGVEVHVTTVRRRLLEAGRPARMPVENQLFKSLCARDC